MSTPQSQQIHALKAEIEDQRKVITQLENSARFSERKELEAKQRAERAERHVATLLDLLAISVPKGS